VASSVDVRLDPNFQCQIVLPRIANYDGPELLLVARPEDIGIQRHRLRQIGDIVAIDGVVSGKFGQRQVVGIDSEQPESLKMGGEEFGKPLTIGLGKAGHPRMLEVQAMLLSQRRLWTGDTLEGLHRIPRNDLDIINVAGRAWEAVTDRDEEPAEAVKLDGAGKKPIYLLEKPTPGWR
jgi:hypothetical protein